MPSPPTRLNGSLTLGEAFRVFMVGLLANAVDCPNDYAAYRRNLARMTGIPNVWAIGSGRSGIYRTLLSLEPDGRDEVILPGYTCVVVPNAVRFAGYANRYVDVRRSDYNVDAETIQAAITHRTRAVIVQHTYGFPADMVSIASICRSRGVALIEDAAHALGASVDSRPVGSWGDAAVFSSVSNKMISTDRGGVLVVNDMLLAERVATAYDSLASRPEHVERLSCLRLVTQVCAGVSGAAAYPAELMRRIARRTGKRLAARHGLQFPGYDQHEYDSELAGLAYPGYERRLSGILCRVARWQIERLAGDIARRAAQFREMVPALAAAGAVPVKFDPAHCSPSYLNLPIVVDDVERWQTALKTVGWSAYGYLRDPLHPPETTCHEINGYHRGMCSTAEHTSRHIVNLPLGVSVADEHVAQLGGIRAALEGAA